MLGKIQATVAEGASKVADRLSGSHGAGGHTHGATGTCLGGTTVEKYIAALNGRTFTPEAYGALFAPTVVAHGVRLSGEDIIGVQALLEHDRRLFTSTFPDASITTETISCDSGTCTVALRYKFAGTMRGPLPSGVGTPTGKHASNVCGMAQLKTNITTGLIEEAYILMNNYDLLTQCGLIAPIGVEQPIAGGGLAKQPYGAQQQGMGGGIGGQPQAMGGMGVGSATTTTTGTGGMGGGVGTMDQQARQL